MKRIFTLSIMLLLVTASLAEAAPSLTVNWQISSDTLRPNSEAAITMTFTNTGLTEVTNAFVKATLGPHLKITSGVAETEVGALSSGSSQQAGLSFKVNKDAVSTSSFITLEIDYYSGTSKYTKTISIPVTIKRLPILKIENVTYDGEPIPGKATTLSFDIVNAGDGPAKDLKISLNQTSLFIVPTSGGQTVIQNLEAYQKEKVEFPIIIDPEADIGIESIAVIMDYYDETKSSSYSETTKIGLAVTGEADFIAAVDGGTNLFYGSMGEVEIEISNKGTGPAEFISIKAESDYGSKEFYVGGLDPDDSETIRIMQDLTGVSVKYPISLKISYRDKFQNSFSVTKTIEVVPKSAPFDFTYIVVVVVVIGVGFWYYRKRKKK